MVVTVRYILVFGCREICEIDGRLSPISEHTSLMQKLDHETRKAQGRPPFECIALLLQGGGALGAYQAGVYQALSEAQLQPDWVAGISIGAINAALIAGNPPEARVEKLRTFWELVSEDPVWGTRLKPYRHDRPAATSAHEPHDRDDCDEHVYWSTEGPAAEHAEELRSLWLTAFWTILSSTWLSDPAVPCRPRGERGAWACEPDECGSCASMQGAAGILQALRPMIPWLQPAGTLEATSYYDTADAQDDARALDRFRSDQRRRNALQRWRRERRHRQLRLFRQHDPTRLGRST